MLIVDVVNFRIFKFQTKRLRVDDDAMETSEGADAEDVKRKDVPSMDAGPAESSFPSTTAVSSVYAGMWVH